MTRNARHERRGITRLSAASNSRSLSVSCGRRACRRRIDNSWRKTRISSSFERSPRASNRTSANSRQATTQTNDTSAGTSTDGSADATRLRAQQTVGAGSRLTTEFVHLTGRRDLAHASTRARADIRNGRSRTGGPAAVPAVGFARTTLVRCRSRLTPFSAGRGSRSRPMRQRRVAVCREIFCGGAHFIA